MAAQVDLWGDIQASAIRTPVAILREQAALLGSKTQNLVEGKVETFVVVGRFHHSFNLVVPALDNYRYNLFNVDHGPELYPVRGGDEGPPRNTLSLAQRPYEELQTEQEFVDWLRRRLSSDETKKIVGDLLAQATS